MTDRQGPGAPFDPAQTLRASPDRTMISAEAVRERVRGSTGFDPSDEELQELVDRVRDQDAAAEFLRGLSLEEEAPALSPEEPA